MGEDKNASVPQLSEFYHFSDSLAEWCQINNYVMELSPLLTYVETFNFSFTSQRKLHFLEDLWHSTTKILSSNIRNTERKISIRETNRQSSRKVQKYKQVYHFTPLLSSSQLLRAFSFPPFPLKDKFHIGTDWINYQPDEQMKDETLQKLESFAS